MKKPGRNAWRRITTTILEQVTRPLLIVTLPGEADDTLRSPMAWSG